MQTSEWVTVSALAIAATALSGAAFVHLVHETRGVPKGRRVAAMGKVAWQGVRHWLPSGPTVAVMTSALGGFLLGGLLCAVGSYLLLQWYASTLPDEENVVAGAAVAMMLTFYAFVGLGLSFLAGLVSGTVAALYVSQRMTPYRRDEGSPCYHVH